MDDVKLICVTADNHNKFYEMHDNGNGTWTASYGRVGKAPQTKVYSMYEWEKKYYEKLHKGYQDVTSNTKTIVDYLPHSDAEIDRLLNALLETSRQYVSKYAKSDFINQKAAQEAQDCINRMAKNIDITNPTPRDIDLFNRDLIQLFVIIPRVIDNTRDEIVQFNTLKNRNGKDRADIVKKEQALLDNMTTLSAQKKVNAGGASSTIEDAFGFTLTKCTNAEIDFIKDRLAKDRFTRYTFSRAWKINTPAREKGFEEYLENNHLDNNSKNVKMYWHGTGTENILSILSNGLLIKPSNASYYSGSMFGQGIYNAPNADKASGYTSISGSYWRGGASNTAYMFLNAVIMGKQYDVKDNYETYGGIRIYNLDGDKFSSADLGYHSVYAHAGSSLRRDECIVYNQNQVACRYLIEFKV